MCLPFSLLRVSKLRMAYFRNHCKIFERKNFAKVIRRLLHLIYFKRFQEFFFFFSEINYVKKGLTLSSTRPLIQIFIQNF